MLKATLNRFHRKRVAADVILGRVGVLDREQPWAVCHKPLVVLPRGCLDKVLAAVADREPDPLVVEVETVKLEELYQKHPPAPDLRTGEPRCNFLSPPPS